MERRFFSGNTVEQAVLAAARHHELDPSRVAYRLRDKKHGFLNLRRRVVIEVDPASPEIDSEPGELPDTSPVSTKEDVEHDGRPASLGTWRGQDFTSPESDYDHTAFQRAIEELGGLLGCELEPLIQTSTDGFEIEFTGPESGVLVEENGRALGAMEHLLPRAVRGFTGQSFSCRVDCQGFKAAQEQALRQLAEDAAEDARREQSEQVLEPMKPAERRLIHLALAEDPTVRTESEGEGFFKRVRILPIP